MTRAATLTYDGRTQSIAAWAREFGLGRQVLEARIKANWDLGRALTTPVRKNTPQPKKLIPYAGFEGRESW